MVRNKIQEQRMQGYFVEAAKEIIKGEGISALSVRNIAERAGYSYATLYNYFDDYKDLIFICVDEFLQECKDYVSARQYPEDARDKIVQKTIAYVQYFIQYQGVYELVFLERVVEIWGQGSLLEKIKDLFMDIFEEDWKECCWEHKTVENFDILLNMHRMAIYGLMLEYINRRNPVEYSKFIDDMKRCMNFLLEKDSCNSAQ